MTSDEEDQPSEDHDSADDTGDEDLNDSGHLGTCSRSTEEESSDSSIHSECGSRGVHIICNFACNVHNYL